MLKFEIKGTSALQHLINVYGRILTGLECQNQARVLTLLGQILCHVGHAAHLTNVLIRFFQSYARTVRKFEVSDDRTKLCLVVLNTVVRYKPNHPTWQPKICRVAYQTVLSISFKLLLIGEPFHIRNEIGPFLRSLVLHASGDVLPQAAMDPFVDALAVKQQEYVSPLNLLSPLVSAIVKMSINDASRWFTWVLREWLRVPPIVSLFTWHAEVAFTLVAGCASLKWVLPCLMQLLDDESENVRLNVIQVLSKLPTSNENVARKMLTLMGSKEQKIRKAVARSLANYCWRQATGGSDHRHTEPCQRPLSKRIKSPFYVFLALFPKFNYDDLWLTNVHGSIQETCSLLTTHLDHCSLLTPPKQTQLIHHFIDSLSQSLRSTSAKRTQALSRILSLTATYGFAESVVGLFSGPSPPPHLHHLPTLSHSIRFTNDLILVSSLHGFLSSLLLSSNGRGSGDSLVDELSRLCEVLWSITFSIRSLKRVVHPESGREVWKLVRWLDARTNLTPCDVPAVWEVEVELISCHICEIVDEVVSNARDDGSWCGVRESFRALLEEEHGSGKEPCEVEEKKKVEMPVIKVNSEEIVEEEAWRKSFRDHLSGSAQVRLDEDRKKAHEVQKPIRERYLMTDDQITNTVYKDIGVTPRQMKSPGASESQIMQSFLQQFQSRVPSQTLNVTKSDKPKIVAGDDEIQLSNMSTIFDMTMLPEINFDEIDDTLEAPNFSNVSVNSERHLNAQENFNPDPDINLQSESINHRDVTNLAEITAEPKAIKPTELPMKEPPALSVIPQIQSNAREPTPRPLPQKHVSTHHDLSKKSLSTSTLHQHSEKILERPFQSLVSLRSMSLQHGSSNSIASLVSDSVHKAVLGAVRIMFEEARQNGDPFHPLLYESMRLDPTLLIERHGNREAGRNSNAEWGKVEYWLGYRKELEDVLRNVSDAIGNVEQKLSGSQMTLSRVLLLVSDQVALFRMMSLSRLEHTIVS